MTGQAQVILSARAKQFGDAVYFVDNLASPLFGKLAISKLGLIQFVRTEE